MATVLICQGVPGYGYNGACLHAHACYMPLIPSHPILIQYKQKVRLLVVGRMVRFLRLGIREINDGSLMWAPPKVSLWYGDLLACLCVFFGAANRWSERLGNAFHHLETTTHPTTYHNPKTRTNK